MGAPLTAALALLAVAAAPWGDAADAALTLAPLPGAARYEIGSDVDPLRLMPTLSHPTKGRLGDFRGDPLDAIGAAARWRWEELGRYLDPTSDVVASSAFRSTFEGAARAEGPEILPALLKAAQEALLEKARALLATRRRRVQRLRAWTRREAELDREVRRLAARARRRGRSSREDGRVRRAREARRALDSRRREILGDLPEAELTMPRLAAYRDRLVGRVQRKVRDLHSMTEGLLRQMR